jgi:hypothetical protein
MKHSLRDVLAVLGFAEDWEATTDQQPGYHYDFGNLTLTACECMGSDFRQGFLFTGIARYSKNLRQIQFELPLEIVSFEVAVALIAMGIGYDFIPDRPTPWFELSQDWPRRLREERSSEPQS